MTGFPSKSGVAGALLIIIPNVMGICTWSPRLDKLGNSVRGIRFCEKFGQRFAVHRFDNLRGVCEAVNYTKKEGLSGAKKDPGKHKGNDKESQLSRLTFAASQGDLKTIKLLASMGIELGGADYDGRTALHVAASDGQTRVVKYLLSRGVDPSPKDRWGGTPLSDAEAANHTRTAAALATQGGKRGRSTSATPRKCASAGALAGIGMGLGIMEEGIEESIEEEEESDYDDDYYSGGDTPAKNVGLDLGAGNGNGAGNGANGNGAKPHPV